MNQPSIPGGTVSEDGKLWALLSYGGLFFGIPLWIAPLLMRNDAFALHHARQAAVIFAYGFLLVSLYTVGSVLISVVTFGILSIVSLCCMPVLFLPIVPTIHGLMLAYNQQWTEPVGMFGLGTKLLGSIQVEQK